MRTKRLRVFAGPNGSGKSSLYDFLVKQKYFSEHFDINADKIAKAIESNGYCIKDWPIQFNLDNFLISVAKNTRPTNNVDSEYIRKKISYSNDSGNIVWNGRKSYKTINTVAAYLVDYFTEKMLNLDSTFFYETVFSHTSKVDLMRRAKDKGFKVYLYFVSTQSPIINWERVKSRVKQGGHKVPREKVTGRYYKSLDNLFSALKIADRVYFFDNSKSEETTAFLNFAKLEKGQIKIESGFDEVPEWFNKYVLEKMGK